MSAARVGRPPAQEPLLRLHLRVPPDILAWIEAQPDLPAIVVRDLVIKAVRAARRRQERGK